MKRSNPNFHIVFLATAATLVLSSVNISALAANPTLLHCSIHTKAGMADADLSALAKVTKAAAEVTAFKAVNMAGATLESSELESEDGCLIYTFDFKIPGKASVVEIAVDAGTGKVLSRKSEDPKAQAAEAAADLAAAKKK